MNLAVYACQWQSLSVHSAAICSPAQWRMRFILFQCLSEWPKSPVLRQSHGSSLDLELPTTRHPRPHPESSLDSPRHGPPPRCTRGCIIISLPLCPVLGQSAPWWCSRRVFSRLLTFTERHPSSSSPRRRLRDKFSFPSASLQTESKRPFGSHEGVAYGSQTPSQLAPRRGETRE